MDPKQRPRLHGRDHQIGGADWLNVRRTVPVVFDGLGSVLTTGVKGDVAIHFDGIITGWRLLADQDGDIIIDIWKSDYASFPPTIVDSITGGAEPELSGADKAEDTTLAGWTTEVDAGDTFRFHIDSVATVTRVTLLLALDA